jgi:Tfp pilus assembly protein PilN
LNLTSLTEKTGQVNLEGTAFSNNEVVRFIDNLKAEPFFTEVMLLESKQAKVENIDVYQYKLQFKVKGE